MGTVLKESRCFAIICCLYWCSVSILWCCYSLKSAYLFTNAVARPSLPLFSLLIPPLSQNSRILGLFVGFVYWFWRLPRALAAFRFVSISYQVFLGLSDFFPVFTRKPWKIFSDVLQKPGCSVLSAESVTVPECVSSNVDSQWAVFLLSLGG